MANLEQQVDFNIIRYANCWEDAAVLLAGLAPQEGDRILSIASAGDNSFSLLTTSPALVVAADINPVQLHLVALKKAAIQHLAYEEVLAFLGFHDSMDRLTLFGRVKDTLPADTRQYWEHHTDTIAAGVIHGGKFERYFRLFARKVLPLIHPRRQTERLLAPKEADRQVQFYHRQWNTWRWRLFFRIFFSRLVMGRLGRDPQFLKEVDITVSSDIFQKAESHLKKIQAQQNPFLRYSLTGNFGTLLPHYLQPEPFAKVKANIGCLEIRRGYAGQVAAGYGRFDGMNLSNIFEYMDRRQFSTAAEELLPHLAGGGRMAYWNLMVPRRISQDFPHSVRYLDSLSEKLSAGDNGFFYNRFIVEQKS